MEQSQDDVLVLRPPQKVDDERVVQAIYEGHWSLNDFTYGTGVARLQIGSRILAGHFEDNILVNG